MAVNISGSVLASLLYDHAQSDGHQMGFLTGEVVSHMIDTISDSQINNYEVETKIYIYGSVACPRDQRFYNERGDVLPDKIHSLLQKQAQNIVGWYSFRRNSTMRPSLMERLLHENLIKFKQQESSHFLFLLCTSKASPNKSTHSFDHSFSCLHHRRFQRKHVNIVNLGDTTHMEYKTLPSQTASNNQGVYSLMIKQQEERFLDAHGQMEITQIQSLNGALSRKLDEISREVADSESTLCVLEEEVQRYRKQVRLKLIEREQKQNPVPVASTSVPKKPSVDDILFMDDGDPNENVPSLQPESTPKIEITKPKVESHSGNKNENLLKSDKGDNSMKTNNKTEIKLTSPASLHGRSNSISNDKSFTQDSNSAIETVHVRSKSADVVENPHMGKKKEENDPFSFVSSIMTQSKQEDEQNKKKKPVKHEMTVPSKGVTVETDQRTSERSTRQRSRNADAASEVAKSFKMSTRGKGKNNQASTLPDLEMETTNDNKIEEGFSEMDIGDKSKSKAKLIGSKTCSQEVGKTGGVSENSQSEESSQDTYDMEVSSSPVY